jgi:hypothetical protein
MSSQSSHRCHVIIDRRRLSRIRTKNRNAGGTGRCFDVTNQVDLDNESVPDHEVEDHLRPVAESKQDGENVSLPDYSRRVGPFGAFIRICGS